MIQKPLTAKDLLKYKTNNPLKWAIKFGDSEIKKEAQAMLELLGEYNHQGIPFPPGYEELVERILGGSGMVNFTPTPAPVEQIVGGSGVVNLTPTSGSVNHPELQDPILSGELTETEDSDEKVPTVQTQKVAKTK